MSDNSAKNIELLDSTLRDGSQGEGVSYSVQDKIHIVQALDELGVKYIEAGNPGSNPKDMEFFQKNFDFRALRPPRLGADRIIPSMNLDVVLHYILGDKL